MNRRQTSFSPKLLAAQSRHYESRPTIGFFKTKTFLSKLFLHLTDGYIDPVISCIQTLKFEKMNRKQKDIDKALPWLSTLETLFNYLRYYESLERTQRLLNEFCWVLYYEYKKPLNFIKKSGEKGEYFYLIMGGSVTGLVPKYRKECLSINEYLVYLIKLKFMGETKISERCYKLNKAVLDIKPEEIEDFCERNIMINYKKLTETASDHLRNLNVKITETDGKIEVHVNDIDTYIKAICTVNDSKSFSAQHKILLYIGNYVEYCKLGKSRFVVDLTPNNISDEITYVANEPCDIGYINKVDSKEAKLFQLIDKKMQKALKDIYSNFFILLEINEENFFEKYARHFIYKKFHKNEFLFKKDTVNEGVYFVVSGTVEIYTECCFDDVDTMVLEMHNALINFFEIFSSLKDEAINETQNNYNKSHLKDPVYSTSEYVSGCKGIKKIEIETVSNMTVLGMNEFYSHETGLNYFNARCLSDESTVFFVNKRVFYEILGREQKIAKSVRQIVELNAKRYINIIKNYKKSYLSDLVKNIRVKMHYYNKLKKTVPKIALNNSNKTNKTNNVLNKNINKSNKNINYTDNNNNNNHNNSSNNNNNNNFNNNNKANIINNFRLNSSKRSFLRKEISKSSRNSMQNCITLALDKDRKHKIKVLMLEKLNKCNYPPILSQSVFSRKLLGESEKIISELGIKPRILSNFPKGNSSLRKMIHTEEIKNTISVKDFYRNLNKKQSIFSKERDKVPREIANDGLNYLSYHIKDKMEDNLYRNSSGKHTNNNGKESHDKYAFSTRYNKTINYFYKS